MTRIDYAFKLFVLVVFPEFSVAMIPMFPFLGGCASLSYSSSPVTAFCRYEFTFFMQGQSSGTNLYYSSHLTMTLYENPTNFDYRLMPSNNQPPVFKNDGRNTEIVFLFDNKMKIHARNKAKVVYSLVFTEANQANIFAGLLISVAPAQYLRCEGSTSYKIRKLFERRDTGSLAELQGDWCIFKNFIRKTNTTTFMMRSTTRTQDERDPLIIFRSTDRSLTTESDANLFGLSISFGGENLNPQYVLETSTPDRIRTFLS